MEPEPCLYCNFIFNIIIITILLILKGGIYEKGNFSFIGTKKLC